MCVGLAAKVVKVKGNIALVDASGARRQVSAELIENLDPGDYVMVTPGRLLPKSAPMTLKKQRNCWRIYNGGLGRSQTARYVI